MWIGCWKNDLPIFVLVVRVILREDDLHLKTGHETPGVQAGAGGGQYGEAPLATQLDGGGH